MEVTCPHCQALNKVAGLVIPQSSHGAEGKNKVSVTCFACGNAFEPKPLRPNPPPGAAATL